MCRCQDRTLRRSSRAATRTRADAREWSGQLHRDRCTGRRLALEVGCLRASKLKSSDEPDSELESSSIRVFCLELLSASERSQPCFGYRKCMHLDQRCIWHSSNFKSQGLVCRLWFKSMFYMFWCCGLAVHVLVVIWEYVLYVLVLWSNVFFMFRCITCNMNNICNRQINATLNITYII